MYGYDYGGTKAKEGQKEICLGLKKAASGSGLERWALSVHKKSRPHLGGGSGRRIESNRDRVAPMVHP